MRNLEVKSICNYFYETGKMCSGRECLRDGVFAGWSVRVNKYAMLALKRVVFGVL